MRIENPPYRGMAARRVAFKAEGHRRRFPLCWHAAARAARRLGPMLRERCKAVRTEWLTSTQSPPQQRQQQRASAVGDAAMEEEGDV